MTWGFVGAAAIGAVTSNVASNKASNAAEHSANVARDAAGVQVESGREASALLDPFQTIGEQGLDLAGFLTDPNQQVDFLQSNPLFQLGLDNANQQTNRSAAARGRLSAGDTLQQLTNNATRVGAPLIQQQKQSIVDLLNFGQATASNQGNLRTGQGAAQAGGMIGASNALNQGVQADINNIEGIGGILSALAANQAGNNTNANVPPLVVGGQSPNTFNQFDPLAGNT